MTFDSPAITDKRAEQIRDGLKALFGDCFVSICTLAGKRSPNAFVRVTIKTEILRSLGGIQALTDMKWKRMSEIQEADYEHGWGLR